VQFDASGKIVERMKEEEGLLKIIRKDGKRIGEKKGDRGQ